MQTCARPAGVARILETLWLLGSCYNSYFDTEPHDGYHIVRHWRDCVIGQHLLRRATSARTSREPTKARSMGSSGASESRGAPPSSVGFVFTSNVDGFFRRAGWDESQILEIHGNVSRWQCSLPCALSRRSRQPVWSLPSAHRFEVDAATMRAPRQRGCRNNTAPAVDVGPRPSQASTLTRAQPSDAREVGTEVGESDAEDGSELCDIDAIGFPGSASWVREACATGCSVAMEGASCTDSARSTADTEHHQAGSQSADAATGCPRVGDLETAPGTSVARSLERPDYECNFEHCLHCGRLAAVHHGCLMMTLGSATVPGPLGRGRAATLLSCMGIGGQGRAQGKSKEATRDT